MFRNESTEPVCFPADGWYFLEARGAQGGAASNGSRQGGLGARMQAYVQLKAGDVLSIAVGRVPRSAEPSTSTAPR